MEYWFNLKLKKMAYKKLFGISNFFFFIPQFYIPIGVIEIIFLFFLIVSQSPWCIIHTGMMHIQGPPKVQSYPTSYPPILEIRQDFGKCVKWIRELLGPREVRGTAKGINIKNSNGKVLWYIAGLRYLLKKIEKSNLTTFRF